MLQLPCFCFRFWIDSLGRIYLIRPLFPNLDDKFYFNVTLSVSFKSGLSDFTSFVIFINTTSNMVLQQSVFSFSTMNPKSELNLSDNMVLLPELYVTVRFSFNISLTSNLFCNSNFKGQFDLQFEIQNNFDGAKLNKFSY